MQDFIVIRGAREHNLKNVSLSIPRNKLTVITGPSGSGKSSLAMDTIYAEGQRRYVESLSAYARQFLEQLSKPEVDSIEGLSPSIAIDQKTVSRSPRSTVGTITEIYDYMRVLYTRIGRPHCHKCGSAIAEQDAEGIIDTVMALPKGSRIQVMAPIVRDRKGEYKKELSEMRAEGFVRARIDGKIVDLTQDITLKKQKRHTIEIIIDRLILKPTIARQLKTAIDTALRHSDTVVVNLTDEDRDLVLSRAMACPACGLSYPEISPRLFSFNSKMGACTTCDGLGYIWPEDEELAADAVECRACKGLRLRPESLSITIRDLNIGQFSALSVDSALEFICKLKLTERETLIARRILKEVTDRFTFIKDVGLGYLTLSRPAITLSGGEAQRIRLATQLGSSLTGVLYVLDEPSIGLHPRDCSHLLKSLSAIRDRGNTVIVVEHDEDTIRWADHVIDIGPGAGSRGGWVVAAGTHAEIAAIPESLTGQYLSGARSITVPPKRRKPKGHLTVVGAGEFNLKDIDVKIPLGVLTCVTGVSGSGKSTLVMETLLKGLQRKLAGLDVRAGSCKDIKGADKIDKVICVEQTPLGRTPRSNPATYTGIFTQIRELFSQSSEARLRGFSSSRFSFNVAGGRCDECGGDGLKKIEMHFLPDVFVPCDVCKGKRYNRETLAITYKGRDIAEVLDMTVSDAREFFSAIPSLRQKLEVIEDVGLGYIHLGQSAPTLSGGEAQRLRLSRELSRRATGKTLYILDEPTTGLHFVDVERLLGVLTSLVETGNSVLVIEHNLDIIKCADHIIDMGPEGGAGGGCIVAQGSPEEISKTAASHTGRFIKDKI